MYNNINVSKTNIGTQKKYHIEFLKSKTGLYVPYKKHILNIKFDEIKNKEGKMHIVCY